MITISKYGMNNENTTSRDGQFLSSVRMSLFPKSTFIQSSKTSESHMKDSIAHSLQGKREKKTVKKHYDTHGLNDSIEDKGKKF